MQARGGKHDGWRAYIAPLALVLGALLLPGGCSGSDEESLTAAKLSQGCVINSDCHSPLVCAFRRCHNQCETSRDCVGGERCVASDRPFHVCQLEEEKSCLRNSDCPEPMVCGSDGECRDQCVSDRDCVSGQTCVSGTCAEPEELDSNGQLPTPTGGSDAGTSGQPCVYSSECPEPLVCLVGSCVPECFVDRDCPRGFVCSAEVCVQAEAGAPECVYNSDCTTPGQLCVSGTCRCQCASDLDCSSGQTCDGCGCVASAVDASAGCFYASDCPNPGELCVDGTCRCECKSDRDCSSGMACDGCGCVTPSPDGAPAGYGSPCNRPSDCPSPLICGLTGQCVYECVGDVDCDASFCCVDNVCVTGSACTVSTTDGGVDASPSDGGAPCASDYECQDGVFCNGIERCVSGACAPASKAECDDLNPCTDDICDEAAKSCAHQATGPVDADKDGHYALACGGTADDCDDRNPDVHAGHPELCDLLDNNCNGVVDEGVWSFGAAKPFQAPSAISYTWGPPSIARLNDGTFVVTAIDGGNHNGYRLDASLAVTNGPAVLQATGDRNIAYLNMATDGTGFIAGRARLGTGGYYCAWIASSHVVVGSADFNTVAPTLLHGLSTVCSWATQWWAGAQASSGPDFAYNGSQYVFVWSDPHLSGNNDLAHVFVATADAAGTVSGARTVLPALTDIEVRGKEPALDADATYEVPAQARLGMGPTKAIVAWQNRTTGFTRYALFDTTVSSLLAGPFDLTEAVTVVPTSATFVGADFYLATQTIDGRMLRVHRVSGADGTVLATTDVANSSGIGDARLADVGGGVAMTIGRGTGVAFGRAPVTLEGGFSFTELRTGAQPSTAAIAPVSATSAALVYVESAVQQSAVLVSCGN